MRILGLTASALLLLTSGLGSLGCDGGAKPKLLPIAPQQVRVGTRLAVPLRVENGGGSRLEFDWVRLQLPQESLTVRITSTPFGGELIYEPLITHLAPDGSEIEREFVIVMKADGAEQRQSVVVKILPAEGTAPIFVSPGPGALVYTDRSAQLRVDIAIKDDDSDQVEISVEGGPPNAMLNQYGPKQATYEWALTPEQIEQPRDTWQVTFYATDHLTRTAHPFTITLRRAALNTCPGTRPEVRVVSPAADANIEGWTYEVRITVTDDVGLRDAPILQYSTTRPDDVTRPDPALFVPVEFEGKGTDALPYIARIRTLPLDLGQRHDLVLRERHRQRRPHRTRVRPHHGNGRRIFHGNGADDSPSPVSQVRAMWAFIPMHRSMRARRSRTSLPRALLGSCRRHLRAGYVPGCDDHRRYDRTGLRNGKRRLRHDIHVHERRSARAKRYARPRNSQCEHNRGWTDLSRRRGPVPHRCEPRR